MANESDSRETDPLQQLSREGVSIWLDDLSRDRIISGDLTQLVDERSVVGVTTNPTIFATAVSRGSGYEKQLRELAEAGTSVHDAVFEVITHDVAEAADLLRPVFDRTGGVDGRVSIEVEPGLAHDTAGTVAQARQLRDKVNRPNVFIKIPATVEGLQAIADATAEGISVNVTLIFSLDRYRAVINAYLTGLERAREAGIDLSTIHSVASFFVSRVDTEIDKRLDAIGSEEAAAVRGQAALANARLAYQVYEQAFETERAKTLLREGANRQRPLWASTGVKDPALPDTLYVTELVVPDVVNTMPEKTMEAVHDHGVVTGDTVTGTYEESNRILDRVDELGISYTEVTELLEREGVEKFSVSWAELLQTVETALG